jgi:hypothetical protein
MIITPQLHSMISQAKLNEAAGELASGLEYARSLAVVYQKPFGLRVDGNRFRVFDNTYKADPNPHPAALPPVDAYGVVLNPIDKKWYVGDFDTLKNYEGVSIGSAPAGGEVRFYPDGHCSDPAASDNAFVLNYAGNQRTVTVDGTTGRIGSL